MLERCVCDLYALEIRVLPCAGNDDGKTGHGADHNGINKSTGHGYQTLANRFFGTGCGSCDRGRTQTSLIGEDTSCNTLLHCHDHSTQCASGNRIHTECALYNFHNSVGNGSHIANHHNQTAEHICHCHKRYNYLGDLRDTLQTADNNQRNTDRDNQPHDDCRPGIVCVKQCECDMLALGIKEVVCRRGNAVDLGNRTDAQQSGKHAKQGEQLCQPLPARTHTIFNIVERTAQIMSLFVNSTILDGEETLGILGRHTEQGSNFHPEQCARTAGSDRSCNTDNVAGTDGGRQCGTECAEAGDLAFALFFILYHELQGETNAAHL